ncbi:COMM domain-containing protein 5-like isoform X1 [Branchiostoma lanceolatum]|uniref:COMM domain-containing protein 5-like isoform X1 n=1 Tax=Branchiostoma lanceolatum TaxID=7740 RepID=UPI003453B01F
MSIIQVQSSKAGGSSTRADRTPFYGTRVPPEVKIMVKELKKLDKKTFRSLLTVAVTALEGADVDSKSFTDLQTNGMTEDLINIIYSGLLSTLRLALRLPQTSLKPELFKDDLKELNIPEEFIVDLASAVFGGKRTNLDASALDCRSRLPTLQNFRWRVDVGISTSALNRVLEPTILMEMTLSDGRIQTFEVPVSKFHELRYNVAHVLREMESLEKRNVLKIQD